MYRAEAAAGVGSQGADAGTAFVTLGQVKGQGGALFAGDALPRWEDVRRHMDAPSFTAVGGAMSSGPYCSPPRPWNDSKWMRVGGMPAWVRRSTEPRTISSLPQT